MAAFPRLVCRRRSSRNGARRRDGHGGVARELLAQKRCTVVGLDQSPDMLAEARRRLPAQVKLFQANAESLPFPAGAFDGLTFTYLLRYVSDPAATLRELARVCGRVERSRGSSSPCECAVALAVGALLRVGLPAAGRVLAHGWAEVGDFWDRASKISTRVGRSSACCSSGVTQASRTCGCGGSAWVEES